MDNLDAMEFLMTYGWAILVVIAAIAALAYFDVIPIPGRANRTIETTTMIQTEKSNAEVNILPGTYLDHEELRKVGRCTRLIYTGTLPTGAELNIDKTEGIYANTGESEILLTFICEEEKNLTVWIE